jgi:hypothetical protein
MYCDIQWELLERLDIELLWGEGNSELDREFYKQDNLIYKLWGSSYIVKDMVIVSGQYIKHSYSSEKNGIAAIDIGFVNQETCPGLVDLIWDNGICRGYVMIYGEALERDDQITPEFLDLIIRVSAKCGFVHSDFSPKNIARINGRLSLIDLDTVMSKISSMDMKFDLLNGSLRPHVVSQYRVFVLDALYSSLVDNVVVLNTE